MRMSSITTAANKPRVFTRRPSCWTLAKVDTVAKNPTFGWVHLFHLLRLLQITTTFRACA